MMIFPYIRRVFRNVIHFSQASLVRLLFLALFLLSITSVSSASFSHLINYQGKLTDNSNIAVPDGAYTLTFRLYTTQTGGTPIWTETHSSTTISSGLFSLMLGSINSLDTVNFNQPLYLSVEVNGDGEMSPRKQIGAVPNAMNAVTLDGLATSSFIRSDATNSASTTNTYLTIQQTGTGNIADFIGPSGTALSITSSGVVTIPGTASATQLSARVATITNLTVTGTTNLTDISSANLSAQSSTIADLSVSSSFNFLGTVITNVATWFNSLFDTRLATKTTSDLAEGSNLYFTYTRASTTAQAVINSTTSLPNITTLTGLTTIGSAGSTTTLPGNLVVGGSASATNLIISQNLNWTGKQGLALFTNGQGGTITGTTGQLLVGVTGSSPAFVTLGGDATINNSGTLTLASVGTPGTYGSASTVPVFTTDSRGRVTAVTNTPITISTTSVTGLGTLATQNANAVNITGGQATFTSLSVSSSFNFLGTVITNVATWFNSLFDTRLATKTTSDLAEGSNLYFTYTRASTTAQAVINSTTSLPNITTLTGLTTIGSAGSTTTLPGNLVVGGSALFNWTSPKTFRAGLGISNPYTAGEVHNDDFILGRYTNSGYMNTGNLLKLVVSGDSDEDYTTILSLNKIWSGDAIYYPPQGDYIKAVDWNGSTIFSLNDNALVYNAGYVGIGNSSPSALLSVGSSNNFQVNSSGRVLANQGASGAGNLAYSFTSDTDTGIYNKSANTLTIQTGGSDRLTVNSSGYVGIGTSTPANRLDIWGNLWVGTSSLPNLIVDTAKNFIGINKSSPQTALDVFGTASSSNLIVSGTATTTNLVVTGNNFQVNSSGRVLANQGASGAGNLAYSFVGNTGTGFYAPASNWLRIQTGGVDRLTIDSSGNVGIGTNPSYRLTVSGDAYISGNTYVNSSLYLPGVQPAEHVTLSSNFILLWNDTTNKVGLGASADIAEKINSPDQLEDGEVVVADPNNDESVVRADRAYSSSVLGVVVKKPGAIIGGKGKYSLVLAGRVRIRVSAENGPIRRGDLITTANTPGYGMLASNSNAGVYAVALENFNPSSSSTTGTILAMVRTGASLPQSPLAKLDSLIAGGKINTTDLWQIDQQTGKIKPFTNLDLSDQTLDNVRAISSASGLWSITAEGVIVAEEVNTKKLTTDLGITTRDRATGEYYCIFIEAGMMRSTLGRCATTTTTSTTNSSPMILPPTDSGMSTTTPSSSVPITTNETTVTTTTVATTTDEGAVPSTPSTPPTTEETTTEPASH